MRVLRIGFALLIFTAVVAVQTSSSKAAQASSSKNRAAQPSSSKKSVGTLIQVMRGILFPNANLIFDVQQNDPGAPKKADASSAGGTATENFANVYTGWQVVENAAVALDESIDLIMKPGRLCENGKPVPSGRADYVKAAEGLRETARTILKAAQEKNQEKVSDLTSQLSDACANCHVVYRDPEGPKGFGDNSIRCKTP